ncbi:MAG: hypothetical protein KME27_06595 [Lyngbya sp. HA4199-MV5]|jgi:hypothetical protein|nr:hypothetical protein [Lyngbya sp. HA4199-MV5]
MLSIKGTFQDGVVRLDEPVEAREGQPVIITFLDDSGETISDTAWADLAQLVKTNQVKTGIGDLAHQHDHYLYGTPKRED